VNVAARLRGLLDRLLARRREAAHDGVSDADLLLRFTQERDEAAFELLVWRHGAMVLGLCHRAVRDEQLAEDAFQAVFLVLARKAGAIRGNLGGWLFKVARRVAARASARQPNVQPVIETPAAPAPDNVEQNELSALLDDEIARLPERLRRPVVLCYLGGRSTEDAGRVLGCPRGTVLSRLATARKRLAARLTRRGVTLPTTLAVATISNRLVSSATASAPAFRNGALALSTATQLADGVLRSMIRTTVLTATAGVVLAATMMTGVGWVAAQQGTKPAVVAGDAPTDPPTPKTAPDAPKPAQPDPADARKLADAKIKKLEELAERMRAEIDVTEKQIDLLTKANGAEASRIEEFLKRFAEVEAELRQVEREILKLEAELAVLKKRLDDKNPAAPDAAILDQLLQQDPTVATAAAASRRAKENLEAALKLSPNADTPLIQDLKTKYEAAEKAHADARKRAEADAVGKARELAKAALQQRVTELELTLTVKKAVRDKLKEERDAAKKLATAAAGGGANVETLRKALEPQRELLARVQREILITRAQRDGVTFSEATGTDAKLDAILRELAVLRKEVQDLKELAKKPK
jgi:RNA polymerase sigma factor (sigma-70 family)